MRLLGEGSGEADRILVSYEHIAAKHRSFSIGEYNTWS